jgi:prepilin-type N-terminal cleavage/methylation domain-containing protein
MLAKKELDACTGFTLIELSIVLVIIGLIVGGILVGQTLIAASQVRATITQLEKFNISANAFYDKYGALPGDMNQEIAAQLNAPPYHTAPINFRTGTQGRGDGNGILDAFSTSVISNPSVALCGETSMFWGDLTWTNMIDGGYTADQTDYTTGVTITNVDIVLPAAKLGGGNYIMVYGNKGLNYFGIISVSSIVAPNCEYSPGTPGLTVAQAYAIDTKIDDGQPQSGRVTAQYPRWSTRTVVWAAGGGGTGASPGTSVTASSTTCYDDAGNTSNTMAYSMMNNSGNGVNCALSLRMQSGD